MSHDCVGLLFRRFCVSLLRSIRGSEMSDFIPLQRQPGLRVSGILFRNMLLPVIVSETRNSL